MPPSFSDSQALLMRFAGVHCSQPSYAKPWDKMFFRPQHMIRPGQMTGRCSTLDLFLRILCNNMDLKPCRYKNQGFLDRKSSSQSHAKLDGSLWTQSVGESGPACFFQAVPPSKSPPESRECGDPNIAIFHPFFRKFRVNNLKMRSLSPFWSHFFLVISGRPLIRSVAVQPARQRPRPVQVSAKEMLPRKPAPPPKAAEVRDIEVVDV